MTAATMMLAIAMIFSEPAQLPSEPTAPGAPTGAVAVDRSADAESLRVAMGVPALVFAVTDDTRTLARGVAGRRAADRPTAARIDDRFHLGSLTKSMTATLAAILVERGEIAWDTTIVAAVPSLAEDHEHGPAIPQAARVITLEQLVAHRSGLPDDRMGGSMLMGMWSLSGPIAGQRARAARAMLARVAQAGADGAAGAEAGAGYVYANANYIIAGHMLEAVTGQTWEDLIRTELFEPLGMTTAGHGPPGMGMDNADAGDPAQPLGHGRGPDGPHPIPAVLGADNPPVLGPAGRVHASVEDLAAYARAHLAGLRASADGAAGGPTAGPAGLLPARAFERLHADPEGDGYALGWAVIDDPDHPGQRISLHDGSNTRWLAYAYVLPARNLAVVCAMNALPTNPGIDPLDRITSMLTEAGVLVPPTDTPAP